LEGQTPRDLLLSRERGKLHLVVERGKGWCGESEGEASTWTGRRLRGISKVRYFLVMSGTARLLQGSGTWTFGLIGYAIDSRLVFSSIFRCSRARAEPEKFFPKISQMAAVLQYDELSTMLGYATLSYASVAPAKANEVAAKSMPTATKKALPKKAAKAPVEEEDDDEDFDVFGDDDDDEEEEAPKESRADMIARLKHEAEVRLKKKEENQRTLVGLDVKPWSTDQDLAELFKKLTTTINLPDAPIKWGEICHQVEVAYGIKKLVMSFVMGSQSSSDEVVEMIEALEDEVQSVEVTSMNVL